jgi:hypothetical protein
MIFPIIFGKKGKCIPIQRREMFLIQVVWISAGVIGISAMTWLCSFQNSNAWASSIMGKKMENTEEIPNLLSLGSKPENSITRTGPAPGLFARYCGQCHPLPSPTAHTAEEWPAVANRMFRIMYGMTGHTTKIKIPSLSEQDTIISYLKAHSSKTGSSGNLLQIFPQGYGLAFQSRGHSLGTLPF